MKKTLLSEIEKNRIRSLHNKVLKEQNEPKKEAEQVINNLMNLVFTDDGSNVFEEDFGDLNFMYEDDMGNSSIGVSFKLDPNKTKFQKGKIGFVNLNDDLNQKLGTLINELQMSSIPFQQLKSPDNMNVNILFGPIEPNVKFEQIITNFIKNVKGDIELKEL